MGREEDRKVLALRNFMDATGKIESSGGKDMSHDPMTQGIHKGTSAIGTYGLMPNTIDEFSNRLPEDETLQELSKLTPEDMKRTLEADPELERKAAKPIMKFMLNKFEDPALANHAYQYGHNLSKERVMDEYQNTDRYEKFKKLYREPMEASSMEAKDRQREQRYMDALGEDSGTTLEQKEERLKKLKSFFRP